MKKIIIMLLMISLIPMPFSVNMKALTGSKADVIFITENPVGIADNIETVSPDDVGTIQQTNHLWVDGEQIKNPEVKSKVIELFEMGCRIIIIDSKSKLSDIYGIFDEDQAEIVRNLEFAIAEEAGRGSLPAPGMRLFHSEPSAPAFGTVLYPPATAGNIPAFCPSCNIYSGERLRCSTKTCLASPGAT